MAHLDSKVLLNVLVRLFFLLEVHVHMHALMQIPDTLSTMFGSRRWRASGSFSEAILVSGDDPKTNKENITLAEHENRRKRMKRFNARGKGKRLKGVVAGWPSAEAK